MSIFVIISTMFDATIPSPMLDRIRSTFFQCSVQFYFVGRVERSETRQIMTNTKRVFVQAHLVLIWTRIDCVYHVQINATNAFWAFGGCRFALPDLQNRN